MSSPDTDTLLTDRTLVRDPGQGALHIVLPGTPLPAMAVFTVPLECLPDTSSAPAVRAYDGPPDATRLCAACLRTVRGEGTPTPTAEQPPLRAPLRVEDTPMLPEDPPESPARHLQAVAAQPRYTPPTLLQEFRGRPLTWSPWKQAPRATHLPLGCEWCGDPGPPMFAVGFHRSPLIQLHASRCGHCQETWVFEVVDPSPDGLKEIAYYKPKAPANGRST